MRSSARQGLSSSEDCFRSAAAVLRGVLKQMCCSVPPRELREAGKDIQITIRCALQETATTLGSGADARVLQRSTQERPGRCCGADHACTQQLPVISLQHTWCLHHAIFACSRLAASRRPMDALDSSIDSLADRSACQRPSLLSRCICFSIYALAVTGIRGHQRWPQTGALSAAGELPPGSASAGRSYRPWCISQAAGCSSEG